jgi:hypothetical protein
MGCNDVGKASHQYRRRVRWIPGILEFLGSERPSNTLDLDSGMHQSARCKSDRLRSVGYIP